MLAATSGARRVLEIGSFTGRTLLSLAAQLRAQHTATTEATREGEHAFALGLEIDINCFNVATQFLRRAGLGQGALSGVSARVEQCDAEAYLKVGYFCA